MKTSKNTARITTRMAQPQNAEELAWHYTTGEIFLKIVETRMLLPTGIGTLPPEKPIVWFSKHPFFEPTAIKTIQDHGQVRRASLREMFELGRGLVRFGYPAFRLLPWVELRKKAQIPVQLWGSLETVARQQGADPAHWWGTTQGLGVDSLVVDVMNAAMDWERVKS